MNDHFIKIKIKIKIPANTFTLRTGTAIALNITINSGQQKKQFLGYITAYQRTDRAVMFEMVASIAYVNVLKKGAKIEIIANCNVESLVAKYDAINIAQKTNQLLDGIVDPTILGPINKNPSDLVVSAFIGP